MRRLALVVLLAAACRPAPAVTTTTPADPPPTTPPRRSDPELAALADRLDPGPQAPLHEALPAWVRGRIDATITGDPGAPETITEAREAILAWEKLQAADDQTKLRAALTFARGLVLAERAVAAGSDDPELLATLSSAYRLVHGLQLFRRQGLFGQFFALAVEMARKEGELEAQQIEEAMAALTVILERAPALHLHATARLLREHPDHPTVPQALARVSQVRLEEERYEEAVALRRLAVARKGARATGEDFAGLAGACLAALDLACAEMSRKTAEERGPGEAGEDGAAAFARRLRDLDARAEKARKALALAPETGLEARIERGHLLLALGRLGEAERTFTALREAHPGDARPLTGLAVLAIHRHLDFVGVTTHIRAARKLAGRDRLYHEVALGTVPVMMIGEVVAEVTRAPEQAIPGLDARFEEVLELARGLRPHDPARAAVLELLFTSAREAVPKFMSKQHARGIAAVRKLPGRALALIKKFPESRDAWRLVFATSRLAADARSARAQVTAPLPAALQQDPDIRLQQARALFDMAVLWEDRTLLAAAAEAVASLPPGVDADTAATLRAMVDAVQGRQGDQPALQRAVDAFAALAERKTGKEQALALNNAAMIVAHAGDVKTALAILARAYEAAPEEIVVGYNRSALEFGLQARNGLPASFGAVAWRGQNAALRVHARAWLVALADDGHGDVAATREDFFAGLAREQAEEFRGRLNHARWGVVEQGEFKLSLGYSTTEGLQILDEVVPHWRLMAPAPNFDALVAARPAK